MQANVVYNYLPANWANIQRGYFIVAMIASIIVFIANCLIYEDNDAKCWYLVIPFYNLYTKFKIFWNKNYFYFHLVPFIIAFISLLAVSVLSLSIIITAQSGIGYNSLEQIATSMGVTIVVGIVIWFIMVVIIGILKIILEYHVSKTYNYDGLFTIGLLLLPVIFYAILGVKCIKSGVLNRIPAGRKVFMFVCVALLAALTVVPLYLHII